ncbi:GyrI-like domain-containing protein [Bacillus sp. 1P06AnD]|uniref:GyrI-like domain-containing protein n=1 Tax=Bacillus sp. 1P06AnD TaxID=3132208 RepID=UPI0039A235F4
MPANKVDYKKKEKSFYMPGKKPELIEIPEMSFIMVDGKGDPNQESGEYPAAIELLYGLSYAIKMSKMGPGPLPGYFEYVVPPLEGLWWMEGSSGIDRERKHLFRWTSMIRQPEFVDEGIFRWACGELKKKKPMLDVSKAYFATWKEGLCVQMMHMGSYDAEPATIFQMEQYIETHQLINGITEEKDGRIRRHHEIYLSDPRRTKTENLKTVIRIPVRKKTD